MGCAVCSRAGWVAEHKTTVACMTVANQFIAMLNSVNIFLGTVCTSSMIRTQFCRALIRRMQEVFPENNVSSSCTKVVIKIGLSQFSKNNSLGSNSSSFGDSRTTLEWCSKITASSPTASRMTAAFCSNTDSRGITNKIRLLPPCAAANA